MHPVVRFPFDAEKFPHVLAYLLREVGPATRLSIGKLLYLADRIHLVRHGRPITGGRYCALQLGPIPSKALDILEDFVIAKQVALEAPQVSRQFVDTLERLVSVDTEPKYPLYSASEEPDLDKLSETDVEVLNEVVDKFGGYTAIELSKMTHDHAAYKKTPIPKEIDMALVFEDEPGANPEVLEYLRETQGERELAERMNG